MPLFQPKVIDVTLVYGTAVIDTAAFDIPMILTSHASTLNRADIFTSYDSVLDAGFNPESPAATMASLLFGGIAKPNQIVIGRRALDEFVVSLTTSVALDVVFSVKLKTGSTSKTFSYTSLGGDAVNDVLTALKAAIDADSVFGPTTTISIVGSTLEVAVDSGQTTNVVSSTNTSVSAVTSESVADALAAVSTANPSYFWMLSDSHTDTDTKAAAQYAESTDRIYVFSSQDTDIRDKVSGNTLEDLSLLGYKNTCFGMWSPTANTSFPEAGVVGAIAKADPGTTTLHGKTLTGVTVNSLTTTQIQNILDWNGNVYLREYGVNFYRDGRMVDGNFLDYDMVA